MLAKITSSQWFGLLKRFEIPFFLASNAASSIGIVFVNKVLFLEHSFVYGTLLTAIHFFITFIGLLLCLCLGVFEFKRIPLIKMLPLCVSFCGFVALTNISLLYNSVGFYQLMKVLTTPGLVVIQTLFYRKTFSTKTILSLILICIGVIIATVTDAEANFVGTVVALSALLITCMYQIWVQTKQKELDCNGFQLLLYQAPMSCIMLLPVSFFSDQLLTKFYPPCDDTIILILVSGLLAFFVNITIFFVIGRTSPVTYNVLGHAKLCVILSLGFLFFDEDMNSRKVLGIIFTLSGVFWYTHIKTEEANAAVKEADDRIGKNAPEGAHVVIEESTKKI